MAQTEKNIAIIPLDLDLNGSADRDKLQKIILDELEKYNHQEISVFAIRIALRFAWNLEKYRVKDQEKLDYFYFYWLRVLAVAILAKFINTKDSRRLLSASEDDEPYADVYGLTYVNVFTDEAAEAYFAAAKAAFTAASAALNASFPAAGYKDTLNYVAFTHRNDAETFIKQLNADFSNLDVKIINTPIWLAEFKMIPPNLPELDPFWGRYLFSPALSGQLFQKNDNKLFFEGFLNLPEEVLKNKSAKGMQGFIEDYIDQKTSKTFSARLILLGQGGAGKTSIVKKLFNEPLEPYEKPTPRIQVRDLPIKNKKNEPIDLSIWDFGGQVIMHSTHSFFISSRSTYIITCNQRANEQPDAWLKLLQGRVSKSQQITVLIVYSHCDTVKDYEITEMQSTQQSSIAPWRRDNALNREFGQSFKLKFFNIDLNPKNTQCLGFSELEDEIKARAMAESETQMTAAVSEVKKQAVLLEKNKQPFIRHQDLVTKLQDTITIEDSVQIFKTANNYGYIFPERPLKDNEVVDNDFIWVSQKHWLSYGVYRLINNTEVVNNFGILTEKLINQALSKDQPLAINKQGEIEQREIKKQEESLFYNSEGIEVLKRVLVNYRWAMPYHKRHGELLLPLATSLDEPLSLVQFAKAFKQPIEKGEPVCLLMEIELGNKPADFFFKLATYLEPHLLETNDLWRTGAMLYFYGSEETRALIEMPDNVLTLKVLGEDKQSFQQLLLINIKETLKSYENITAHSSEQVWIEGKSKMLSSDVIASLTSDSDIVQKIKDQLMEKGRNMTTININGNVTGNIGDSNTFDNKGDINNQTITMDSKGAELIEQLQKLSVAMPIESKEKQDVDQSIALFEQVAKETDQPKKASLCRQAVEFAKDAVAVDKFAGLYMEYLPKINEMLSTIFLNGQ